MFTLKVSKKEEGYSSYGDTVELHDDGVLSINMYDGHTKLSKEEAIELADALIVYYRS